MLQGTIHYRCARGATVTTVGQSSGSIKLRWNGRYHTLHLAAGRYGNSVYTWTADGDQFSLLERGQPVASRCAPS